MKYTLDEIKESVNTKLWLIHPFLAQVCLRMGIEYIDRPDDDAWAWNDGLKLVINMGKINNDPLCDEFKISNIVFLVGHEAMHTITLTNERSCGRNPELWNMATDYAINSLLINNYSNGTNCPVGEMPRHSSQVNDKNPDGLIGLYKPEYRDFSAEKIYEILLQESNKSQQQQGDGDGEGQGQSLDLGGMGTNGNSKSKAQRTAKDGSGQIGWDKHGEGQKLTNAQKAELKAKLSQVMKDMETGGYNAGKGSSTIFDRMMEQVFKEPPFDWRGFLESYLKSYIKDDYTWKRPSRRSQGAGVNLPGNSVQKTMKVGIAIDTSGSVGNDQLEDFFSHINKIMKSFKQFQVDVWCFSTLVHLETFHSYTQTDSDITCQKIQSTGGTDIKSNFTYLENENQERYDCFIILTDGYDYIEDLTFNKYPVIWGIIDNKRFKAPEGVLNSIVMPMEFDD